MRKHGDPVALNTDEKAIVTGCGSRGPCLRQAVEGVVSDSPRLVPSLGVRTHCYRVELTASPEVTAKPELTAPQVRA